MPDMQMGPLIAAMAKELGVDAERVAAVFERRVERGEILLPTVEDPLGRAREALKALGRYLEGGLAREELPQELRSLFQGLGARMGAAEVEEVPARPQERGLPQALEAMADAAAALPSELYLANVEPRRLRDEAREIRFYRGVLAEVLLFADLVLDNLTVRERRAADALARSYRLVRQAALSKPRLGEPLQPVEDYCFGSKKAAAETRTKNRAREMALTQKATRRARLEVGSEARRDLADNLSAALEALVDRKSEDRDEPLGR